MKITAGGWHSCGLRKIGTVVCWGSNQYGQLAAPTGVFIDVRWQFTQTELIALNNRSAPEATTLVA